MEIANLSINNESTTIEADFFAPKGKKLTDKPIP